jgi:hypothetical protein
MDQLEKNINEDKEAPTRKNVKTEIKRRKLLHKNSH